MKFAFGALAALLLASGWLVAAGAGATRAAGLLPRQLHRRRRARATTWPRPAASRRRRAAQRLSGFNRCTGDIGNDNGVLHCNFAGGPVWAASSAAAVRRRTGAMCRRRRPTRRPPAYAPPPAYGAPPAGWEQARWERCHHLHQRVEELRAAPRADLRPARARADPVPAGPDARGARALPLRLRGAADGAAFLLTCGCFRGTQRRANHCAPYLPRRPGRNRCRHRKSCRIWYCRPTAATR